MTGRAILIVYDVFDDTRRDTLRRKLTPLASRVQQSGWLIPAGTHVDLRRLGAALADGLNPADRTRLYSPCATCAPDTVWFQTASPTASTPATSGSAADRSPTPH